MPDHLTGEMGTLIVALSDAIERLPSLGRVQLAQYGDGGAHLHLFFFVAPTACSSCAARP